MCKQLIINILNKNSPEKMQKSEKKVPKMSVIKLTAEKIAKKAGVSKHTVESTMTGRRTNKKVVAVVKELNAGIEKLLK
jgi:hypothetical protein